MKKHRCPVTVGLSQKGEAKLIYCGQWSCPHCAAHLAKRWAVRAKLHIQSRAGGEKTEVWFITLTLGSKYKSAAAGFAALPKLWNRLRMQFQRKYDNWQYMAFVEGQPERGGMPHFHILSSQPPNAKINKKGVITKHAVHDWAHKMGWGFEAELKLVNSSKAASYVAKYATKQHPATPDNFRRVRISKDWTKLPRKSELKLLVPAKEESLVNFLVRAADTTGLHLEDLQKHYLDGIVRLRDERQRFENLQLP